MGYNPSAQGTTFKGASRSIATGYQNGSGSTIPLATPVAVNATGHIVPVDITNEATVTAFVGLTNISMPAGSFGLVTSAGRLENAQTSFAVGTPIWVGHGGTITNVRPDLSAPGWSSGDFVIFLGIVVQNEFDSSKQDIQLFFEIVGQL